MILLLQSLIRDHTYAFIVQTTPHTGRINVESAGSLNPVHPPQRQRQSADAERAHFACAAPRSRRT